MPGYGLAVAQAQHELKKVMDLLEDRGIDWKSLDACLGGACPPPAPAAPAPTPAARAAPMPPAAPYVAQFGTPTPAPAGVVAAVASLRAPSAAPAAVYVADLAERGAVTS